MPLALLNADHVGEQGFEPQRVNNALMYISGLGGSEDVLTLSLNSFPIPKRTIGILEVGYLNDKRKFAGNPVYDDLSVIFKDYVDAETARLLWKWNYLVHNPENGKTGLARSYKKQGWVHLLSPEGSIERIYDLVGIWPSGFDGGDADMMGEDTMNITVTITIDKAIPSTGLRPSDVA